MNTSCFFNLHHHKPSLYKMESILNVLSVYELGAFADNFDWFSIGIHPWYMDQNCDIFWEKILEISQLKTCLAIGETGMDRLIKTPIELQKQIFVRHIELAEKLQKPLIIHCVKAFEEILNLRKSFKATMPWIFHGFDNKLEIASKIIQSGGYISIGKSLLKENSNASKILRFIPEDKLFFETDADEIEISQIYEKAAFILNVDILVLKNKIWQNFVECFKYKI